jgi:hypothetical protein
MGIVALSSSKLNVVALETKLTPSDEDKPAEPKPAVEAGKTDPETAAEPNTDES